MPAEGVVVAQQSSGSTSTDQGQQQTQAQQTDQTTQAQGGSQQQQQQGQPGTQPGQQSGQDDPRFRGITADLQKERRARQTAEQSLQALQSRFDEMDRRLKAAAGVDPSGTDQAREKLREQFKTVFPELAWMFDLSDEERDAMRQAPRALGSVQQQEQREWTQRGNVYKDAVSTQIADALNVEKLSDQQAAQVHRLFAGWFQETVEKELQASEGQSSATLDRYERNDQALVTDFVKAYRANWIDPARRQATAGIVNRASQRVPDSTGRNAVISSDRRPKPGSSLDEKLQFVTDSMKEQGYFRQ